MPARCRRAPRRRIRRPRICCGSSGGAAGKALEPFVYRDFGSLVSLGEYSTVGSLMGFLVGKNLFIEGYFARLMYRSLYKMHEYALHGASKTFLAALVRGLSRGAEPAVKLH